MKLKFKRAIPYDIHIESTANDGFIVRVGCCICVYTNIDEMMDDIKEYINDPETAEKQYNQCRGNPRAVPMPDECCQEQAPIGYGTTAGNTLRRNVEESIPEPMNSNSGPVS